MKDIKELEGMTRNDNVTEAENKNEDKENTLLEKAKEKYKDVYELTTEITEDDDEPVEIKLLFKKPNSASFNRYIKTSSKNAVKSLETFILENIIEEQKAELLERFKKYPAMPLGLGQKLLEVLGFSNNVGLKKL